MRRIKFKAWDKVNKRFIVDYTKILPAHYNGSKYPDQGGVDHNVIYVQTAEYETDCELLLYTGLKDRNGKEIYEGDIVELEVLTEPIRYRGTYWELKRYAVEYKDQGYIPENLDESVVIGNIFENPELLEVK